MTGGERVECGAGIYQVRVYPKKVLESRFEAAADYCGGDVMASFGDARFDARDRQPLGREGQKNDLDVVSEFAPAGDVARVVSPAEGAFKGEALALANVFLHSAEHDFRGGDGGGFGGERCEALGDEIGVDEFGTVGFMEQEFAGEGGLSSAVGASDDYNLRAALFGD